MVTKAIQPQRLQHMYALYQTGKSLAEVAAEYRVTRQSVHGLFAYHGLQMRPRAPDLPAIEFGGNKYTMRNTGYYARTDGKRTLLHRDMWEAEHGPIPDGWDVHHLDEDKTNNALSNFECMPKADHTRLHHQQKGQ